MLALKVELTVEQVQERGGNEQQHHTKKKEAPGTKCGRLGKFWFIALYFEFRFPQKAKHAYTLSTHVHV